MLSVYVPHGASLDRIPVEPGKDVPDSAIWFDLITPNEREARFSLADQDTGVRPIAAQLHEMADAKTVILKLGDRGVITCRPGKEGDLRSFFVVDSFAERVVDAAAEQIFQPNGSRRSHFLPPGSFAITCARSHFSPRINRSSVSESRLRHSKENGSSIRISLRSAVGK